MIEKIKDGIIRFNMHPFFFEKRRGSKEDKTIPQGPKGGNNQNHKNRDVPCHHFSTVKNTNREQVERCDHRINLDPKYANLGEQAARHGASDENKRSKRNTEQKVYNRP